MRFGWLTALVVGMLVAAPAHAANFVQYSIRAHGTMSGFDVNSSPYPSWFSRETDFVVTFSVDTERYGPDDANWNGEYISDGSSFRTIFEGSDFTAKISNGDLFVNDNSRATFFTNNSHLSINVDPSINTFDGIGNSVVSGQADLSFNYHYTSEFFTGSISAINVSATHGYAGISAYAVPTAVPEPAAWVMMILGIGVVGGMERRGRRVAVS